VPRLLAAASATLLTLTALVAPVTASATPPAPAPTPSTAPAADGASPITINRPVEGELVRWPTARGRASGAVTVELRRHDDKLLGQAPTWNGGDFELQPAGYLGSGTLSFRVVGIDAAGVRTTSDLRTVQVDRTLLDRPALTYGPGLGPWYVGHVGANRMVYGYNGTSGATVHATVDGVAIPDTPDAGPNGRWSFRLPEGVQEGQHTLGVVLTSSEGRSSLPLSTTLTLDVRVPDAPTITTPTDGGGLGSPPHVITGTGEPGLVRLAVFVDGRYLGWTGMRPDGSWAWHLDDYVVKGRGGHWLAVIQQDQAGNKSERVGVRFVLG
jgi:hypothetical protein